MATNTTNFGLKKPAYTDTADIADINGNMDKVDVSLNGLADAIAIVANNNTHAAITAGQFVYVHGHGSLAEGLYTAKSNIAANATLSTSNLQADGSGGLNALNSNLTSLSNLYSSNVSTKSIVSTNSGVHMTYTGNTAFTMIVTNQNVCAHISKLGGGASPEIHLIYGQFNNHSTNSTETYLNTGGSVRTMIIFTTAQPSDINITAY